MAQPAVSLHVPAASAGRRRCLLALGWAFGSSNLVRVLTYTAAMRVIHDSGRSDR